jgi:hypothetical protein
MTTNDDGSPRIYPSIYSPDFFKAWEKFADQINLVFQYDQEAEARPIATKQMQHVMASLVVAQLLTDVGQPETAAHFHTLAEALQDVANGISHPLFKVEKTDKFAAGKRGRQHDTSETWRIRSSLCIGVEFLIAGGLDQDAAVTFVIQKHRKQLVKLLRPGTGLKSCLQTWLKTFATDATSNDVALVSYKEGMRGLEVARVCRPEGDIRSAGEQLVARAAVRAAKLTKIQMPI